MKIWKPLLNKTLIFRDKINSQFSLIIFCFTYVSQYVQIKTFSSHGLKVLPLKIIDFFHQLFWSKYIKTWYTKQYIRNRLSGAKKYQNNYLRNIYRESFGNDDNHAAKAKFNTLRPHAGRRRSLEWQNPARLPHSILLRLNLGRQAPICTQFRRVEF